MQQQMLQLQALQQAQQQQQAGMALANQQSGQPPNVMSQLSGPPPPQQQPFALPPPPVRLSLFTLPGTAIEFSNSNFKSARRAVQLSLVSANQLLSKALCINS